MVIPSKPTREYLYSFLVLLLLFAAAWSCTPKASKIESPKMDKERQQAIIDKYLVDSARQYSYNSPEWQNYIDMGLAEDSTIAYLWQQKAMPLFKQGKYEVGMKYLDKAVHYDRAGYLGYRAFIKTIFAKTYEAALLDLEDCVREEGNIHVMDHTYRFYMALCYLQLNDYVRAEELLKLELDEMAERWGEDAVHHLELFYYAITKYEQQNYKETVEQFDKLLKIYPQFAEAHYYKAIALGYLGEYDRAVALIDTARKYRDEGYTINEDNAIYERYPYQLRDF